MTGCYVHIPFCDRICPYCDFAVVKFDRRRVGRYLAALRFEIERAPGPAEQVGTLYLGGGTPSTLSVEEIAELLALLFRKFNIESGSIECTAEANPSRRDSADLRGFRNAGITRLSVGVQSFDDSELRKLGRDHDAAQARSFIEDARAAGFDNLSLDLIAGAPGQTKRSFSRSLDMAVACDPKHVSVYALTIEEATPYAAWYRRAPATFPSDDAVADLLQLAHDKLAGAGFQHYEISNFAKPGFECAHNWGYWQQRDCIAFGLSAAGLEDGVRYRNARNFDEYCSALESGRSARQEEERLGAGGRAGEAAMLALRTAKGIVDEDFRRRFGIEPAMAFRRAREKFAAAGLLDVDGLGARLTDRGRLLANEVCAAFLEPEMETIVTT